MSRWLIFVGLALLVAGLILHFAPSLLNWFGKLPGDIRVATERGRYYLPITSSVLVSLALTILYNLFRR